MFAIHHLVLQQEYTVCQELTVCSYTLAGGAVSALAHTQQCVDYASAFQTTTELTLGFRDFSRALSYAHFL